MSDQHTSATLPLPFVRRHQARPGYALPLAFDRRLGQADGGSVQPPKPTVVAGDWHFAVSPIADKAACLADAAAPRFLQRGHAAYTGPAAEAVACLPLPVVAMRALEAEVEASYSPSAAYAGCNALAVGIMPPLRHCARQTLTAAAALTGCGAAAIPFVVGIRHGFAAPVLPVRPTAGCFRYLLRPRAAGRCARYVTTPTRMPPGSFYPLPLPEPPPPPRLPRACGPQPPPHRMPLAFTRRRVQHHSASIPLPFACFSAAAVPILKSYIMQTEITAEADGQTIHPVSARLTSDMGGFCWQGSVTLYPEDFARLQLDTRQRGREPLITLTVNGEPFVFAAEDYADNREFGRRTYTVSGRSVTARLTADYAKTRHGTVQSRLYARQLAQEQLAQLPYSITFWDIPDWLVPAGSYTLTDKTPMDVLQDIAQAAGGFVESHPARPQLAFRRRWPKAAWELAAASPDVVVPDSVMVSASGHKRVNPRFDRVMVYADHAAGVGGDVYRTSGDRTAQAPALIHPLYTELPVCRAAGAAALSDSGIHKIETVKLPVSDEYSLPRARLGQLWQFNEPTGSWRGIVQGVELEIGRDANGAPSLWQRVTVDRYLDS